MDKADHFRFWLESSQHDLDAAESLFVAAKYDWCLFLAHLVLEKTLKALVALREDRIPAKTHNLVRLAADAGIGLTEDQKVFLDEVNDFNLEIRYPDFKRGFYALCTREYTERYFDRIKEFRLWLISLAV